jgi:hypothetical protein
MARSRGAGRPLRHSHRGQSSLLLLLAALTPAIDGGGTVGAAGALLIKGGTVVNHDRQWKADVLVHGGVIVDVGQDLVVRQVFSLFLVPHHSTAPGGEPGMKGSPG